MKEESVEIIIKCCKERQCIECPFKEIPSCIEIVDYIIARIKEADELAALAMKQKMRADKIRKETAKEIFDYILHSAAPFTADIQTLAEKYGVKVDV